MVGISVASQKMTQHRKKMLLCYIDCNTIQYINCYNEISWSKIIGVQFINEIQMTSKFLKSAN